MRRLFSALVVPLVLLLLAPITQASAASPKFGAYHALIIGNNNYDKLTDLKTAASDAKSVAQLLKSKYGFKVRLLIDATRADVIGALAKIRAKLTPGDNLLIYYAGHGVLDEYAGEGYWLPVDAGKDDPSNWISNGDITNMVRAIQAKHVMVVADSCYSGTLVRAAQAKLDTAQERNVWLLRMNEKRSRTALVSGGLEPVIDTGGGGHSVFAKAFLDQLSENPDVLDGQRLYAAVGRPVALESDQTPQYSDIRRSGHEGGDFLFVRTAGVAPAAKAGSTRTAKPSPALPQAELANPAVELAFWDAIKNSTDPVDFQSYLTEYPTGSFVLLAQRRLQVLSNAKVASVAKDTGIALASDHNGSWVGEVVSTFCQGFDGSVIDVEIVRGQVKGKGYQGLQLNGWVENPLKIRGEAWTNDTVTRYVLQFAEGKWQGEWKAISSNCYGAIELVRKP